MQLKKKQGNPSCYRWTLWSSPRIHTNPNYLMGKRTLNINNPQARHETLLRHCVSTVLSPPVHELITHTKLTQRLQFPTEAPHPICSNLFSPSMHPTHPLHLTQMRSNSSSSLTKTSCLGSAEASFPTWNVPVVSVAFHGSLRASQYSLLNNIVLAASNSCCLWPCHALSHVIFFKLTVNLQSC